MDVAHDALAGGNGAREFVLDGMAGFVLRDRRIDLRAVRLIAVSSVRAGVNRRAIIGVDDVAGGAATRAIVAGMIVGAGERKDRVKQARFLKAEENGVGAKLSTKTAVAQ